jgi:4-amino-4-deoxy-L-arabinose transferase-like glycosyltransferase
MPYVERWHRRLTVVFAYVMAFSCLVYTVAGPVRDGDVFQTVLFSCGALACVGALEVFRRTRWRRADERRARLLATGTRVRAALVSSRRTGKRIWGRTVFVHTFEYRMPEGVLRAETQALAKPPVGASATIAYDSDAAVVVEDLDRPSALRD